MQLVVNTEGAFYRHYLRVRRWYGANEEPAKRGGLCKPCQTILWGTLFAAVVSPLVGIGWLLAKAFDRVVAGGGNAIIRRVGGWRVGSGNSWAEVCDTQGFVEAPVVFGAITGFFVLATAAAAAGIVGVFGLGLWHVSDIAAWIAAAAAWIGGASLTVGWFIFAGFAHLWLAISATIGAILQAGAWAIENWSWLAGHAAIILAPMVVAATLSWAFVWFCLNTRLGERLLADPARGFWRSHKLAAGMRKYRREEAAKWSCACGHRNSDYRTWCSSCGEKRDYGPPGLGTRLSRWFRGRTVAGKMHVMGGGGIAWAFAKSLAKGVCPLVEFLSPEEMREKARTAAAEGRAKRADAIGRILGRKYDRERRGRG